MLSVGVNTRNQINSSGFVYDAAGNIIADGSLTMTYDAENRMTATAGVTYSYDGDGKRVMKSNAGTPPVPFKLYWYGMSGLDVLLETDAAGNTPDEYIFFGGKRIARRQSTGTVSYYFSDHLGTSRVVTNATGTLLDDSDFYPFGGERVVVNNDPNQYKFTGKERDSESGLDNFGARYNSSSLGRFMSVDPVAGSLSNPQSLNRYTYVLNNPLKFIDPTGMVVEWADSEKKKKKDEAEARTSAQRKYENQIAKLLASKNPEERARGERLSATYERLKASKATFRVVSEDSGSRSSGELKFNGDIFIVSLKGNANEYGAIDSNQKVAHEFEHGRQVLDGELSFHNYDPPDWKPWAHDRTDEAKAFAAGFDATPVAPDQGAFLTGMRQAVRTGGIQGGIDYLGRSSTGYRNLAPGPINVTLRSPAIYEVPK
jgi:RHS repeat-associated protein